MTKSQTKKIKKEVMIAPVPKAEAPTGVQAEVASLKVLEVSEGWLVVRHILDENIKYLELAILDKIDPITKQVLTDEEVEKLRDKRNLNVELRDLPGKYSKVLEDTGEIPKNFDPYYSVEELIKARKGIIKDDKGK